MITSHIKVYEGHVPFHGLLTLATCGSGVGGPQCYTRRRPSWCPQCATVPWRLGALPCWLERKPTLANQPAPWLSRSLGCAHQAQSQPTSKRQHCHCLCQKDKVTSSTIMMLELVISWHIYIAFSLPVPATTVPSNATPSTSMTPFASESWSLASLPWSKTAHNGFLTTSSSSASVNLHHESWVNDGTSYLLSTTSLYTWHLVLII